MMAVLVVGVVGTDEVEGTNHNASSADEIQNLLNGSSLRNNDHIIVTQQITITTTIEWKTNLTGIVIEFRYSPSGVSLDDVAADSNEMAAVVINSGSLTVSGLTMESSAFTAFKINSGVLTLGENCILHGNRQSDDLGVLVGNQENNGSSTLNINGAEFYGFQGHKFYPYGGKNTTAGAVGVVGSNSYVVMTAGTIRENNGAVTATNGGTFELKGGMITNNNHQSGYSSAGAIYSYGGKLILAGGSIVDNNTAGVTQYIDNVSTGQASLTIGSTGIASNPLIIVGNRLNGAVQNLNVTNTNSVYSPPSVEIRNLHSGSYVGIYAGVPGNGKIVIGAVNGADAETVAKYFFSDRILCGATVDGNNIVFTTSVVV